MRPKFALACTATFALAVLLLSCGPGTDQDSELIEYYNEIGELNRNSGSETAQIAADLEEALAASSQEASRSSARELFTAGADVAADFAVGLNALAAPPPLVHAHANYVEAAGRVANQLAEIEASLKITSSPTDVFQALQASSAEAINTGRALTRACQSIQDLAEQVNPPIDIDCINSDASV